MPAKKKSAKKSLVELPNNNFKTNAELDNAIGELGKLKREHERLVSHTNDRISKAQSALAEKLDPLDQKIEHIAAGINSYVKEHREELFKDGSKTAKMIHGNLSYRSIPASVKTRTSAKFIDKLLSENKLIKLYNLCVEKFGKVYLRVKLEFNKDALLADRIKAKQMGFEFNEESERLYIKPHEVEAEIEASKAA